MNETKIKMIIVDSYPVFRYGLSSMLNSDFPACVVAGEATYFDEVAAKFREIKPDIITVDLTTQKKNGKVNDEVLREILDTSKLIVFDIPESEDDVLDAIRSGASSYILKSAKSNEITGTIRRVADGEISLSPSIITKLVRQVRRGRVDNQLPFQQLTAREKDILQLAALGASNQEIAEEYFISITTVKTHLRNIMAKLDVKNRTKAVAIATANGLLPKPQKVMLA